MKKLAIIGALALAGVLLFKASKKDDAAQTHPQSNLHTGFNADGTPRPLTNQEAQSYWDNNTDLVAFYNDPSKPAELDTIIKYANWHWLVQGYKDNRVIS